MNNVDKELAKRAKHMYSYQVSVETIAKELGTSVRQVTFWLIESGFILSNQPPLAGKTTKLQIIQEIEAILDLEGQLSDFMKVDKKTLTLSRNKLTEVLISYKHGNW